MNMQTRAHENLPKRKVIRCWSVVVKHATGIAIGAAAPSAFVYFNWSRLPPASEAEYRPMLLQLIGVAIGFVIAYISIRGLYQRIILDSEGLTTIGLFDESYVEWKEIAAWKVESGGGCWLLSARHGTEWTVVFRQRPVMRFVLGAVLRGRQSLGAWKSHDEIPWYAPFGLQRVYDKLEDYREKATEAA